MSMMVDHHIMFLVVTITILASGPSPLYATVACPTGPLQCDDLCCGTSSGYYCCDQCHERANRSAWCNQSNFDTNKEPRIIACGGFGFPVGLTIGIILGGALVIGLIIHGCCLLCQRRRRKQLTRAAPLTTISQSQQQTLQSPVKQTSHYPSQQRPSKQTGQSKPPSQRSTAQQRQRRGSLRPCTNIVITRSVTQQPYLNPYFQGGDDPPSNTGPSATASGGRGGYSIESNCAVGLLLGLLLNANQGANTTAGAASHADGTPRPNDAPPSYSEAVKDETLPTYNETTAAQ